MCVICVEDLFHFDCSSLWQNLKWYNRQQLWKKYKTCVSPTVRLSPSPPFPPFPPALLYVLYRGRKYVIHLAWPAFSVIYWTHCSDRRGHHHTALPSHTALTLPQQPNYQTYTNHHKTKAFLEIWGFFFIIILVSLLSLFQFILSSIKRKNSYGTGRNYLLNRPAARNK